MSLPGLIALVLLSLVPLLVSVPEWLVATWIGSAWGANFLVGLSLVWCRTAFGLLTSAVIVGLTQFSMVALTDFGSQGCWLLATLIVASGWLVGILLVPWQGGSRVPGVRSVSDDQHRRMCLFSSWDLICATAFVAVLCWLVPRLDNWFDLLAQTAPAWLGGAILSMLAVPWAWQDRWTPAGFLSAIACVAMALTFSVPWLTPPLPWRLVAVWLLGGPLTVMAAQAIVVLLGLASLRRQAQHQSGCGLEAKPALELLTD